MIEFYYILAALLLMFLLMLRNNKVHEFRHKWHILLKDSPEGLSAFYNLVPGYNTMVIKFWKPLRDRYWIPPAILAEKYMSEMDADTRRKTMEWIKSKGGQA